MPLQLYINAMIRYKLDGDSGHLAVLLSLLRDELADSSGGCR
jgi:hypothetical protein